jgi:hypothetical protein
MKREITDGLAKAAYEARLKLLAKGVYPKSAFTVPRSDACYQWDDLGAELNGGAALALKDVYRQEGEAVVDAFIQFVMRHSTTEAGNAFARVLHEIKDHIFTDVELAQMEGGERQDE